MFLARPPANCAMKFQSFRHPPRTPSTWRAVLAGVVAHPLIAMTLSLTYGVVRPFVWAAVYSEPAPPYEWSPTGRDWLFLQGIGFVASIVAGWLAAYWSPPKTAIPIALLVLLSFVVLLFGQFPLDASIFRNVLYALHTPVGLVFGALALLRWQSSSNYSAV